MKTTANPLNLLALCLLLLMALSVGRSQTVSPPGTMSFQGYLTDASGNPLGSTNTGPKNYTVVFRIWDSQTGGNELNAEQQTVTVNNGYFSILLGQGSAYGAEPHVGSLATVFTGATANSRYVEMVVVGIGAAGANVTIAPRLQLVSSPFAYLAANAVNASYLVNTNSTAVVNVNNGSVGIGTATPAATLEVNGTAQVDSYLSAAAITVYGAYSSHGAQGAYLEWNKNNGDGGTWLVNQKGGGTGGFHFDEVNNANGLTERLTISGASGNVGINTTTPGSTLTVNGTASVSGNLAVSGTISGNGSIPLGGIILWSGSASTVPAGWALCNGQTAYGTVTPNLTDRFVIGAGGSYGAGATGGATNVTLNINQIPPHSHSYEDGIYVEHGGNYGGALPNWAYPSGGGLDWVQSASGGSVVGSSSTDGDNNCVPWRPMNTANAGGGQPFDNRPAFYALAYIERVQ